MLNKVNKIFKNNFVFMFKKRLIKKLIKNFLKMVYLHYLHYLH